MNEEQLYKNSFEELSIILLEASKNNAMLKAQAEFYLSKANELAEENKKLIEENEQLKEDLRKLESKPDISDVINNTTEENK